MAKPFPVSTHIFTITTLTISLLSLIILHLTPCRGYTFDCVKLPRPPLHGTLKYIKGTINARLKCPKASEDVAWNSPGKSGILTCDPNAQITEFEYVPPLKCLPYRKPEMLRMPARFMFGSRKCAFVRTIGIKIRNILESLVPKNCSTTPPLSCKWVNLASSCGDNLNSYLNGNTDAKQIDVELDLVAFMYNPEYSVETYVNISNMIKTTYLKSANKSIRSMKYVNLYKARFGSWKASCSDGRNANVTAGTDLTIHNKASCRGCPANHVMDLTKQCWRCRPLYYTMSPYAEKCIRCPPERNWDNITSFKENCLIKE